MGVRLMEEQAKKETESIIDNPCYHCYTGAIGECALASCKYMWKSWSKDLESEYICISEKETGRG